MSTDKTWISGLDLGTEMDPASLAVAEVQGSPKVYNVRHLKQWQLGTSPTIIIDDLAKLFKRPPLSGTSLAIDRTGAGIPVLYSMREKSIDAHLIPIHIHAGFHVTKGRGFLGVPKPDLMSALKIVAGQRRMHVSPKLPLAKKAQRELENFLLKITERGREEFGNADISTHDDLVTALALLAWAGDRHPPAWALKTYPLAVKKQQKGRHILICGRDDLGQLEYDWDLPTLVINIHDPPGAEPALPTGSKILGHHQIICLDQEPTEVQGQWTQSLQEGMYSPEQAKRLHHWLNQPQFQPVGTPWRALIVIDNGPPDRRAMSIGLALADTLRIPRDAVVEHGNEDIWTTILTHHPATSTT
jgi:hypothetical protein